MRQITPVLVLACATFACSAQHRPADSEDFASAFSRMQSDPEVLASRAAPTTKIVEEIWRSDIERPEVRSIPCTVREISAGGWDLLPSADKLAQTGSTYSLPEHIASDQLSVTLGPAEGAADTKYSFQLVDGTWRLMRVEVYSYLAPGAATPPLPCRPGHRPNNSFKPKPLRGSA